MTKIINLPFWYEVDFIRKRCSTVESTHLVDSIPVRIVEVSDRDAPVVIRAEALRDEHPFEMRMHGGHLYGPVDDLRLSSKDSQAYESKMPLDYGIDDLGSLMQAVADGRRAMHWLNYPLPTSPRNGFGYVPKTSVTQGDIRKIVGQTLDADRARAHEAAEGGFIIVDGRLFAKEAEPRWCCKHVNSRTAEEMRAANGMPFWVQGLSLRRVHQIDRGSVCFRGDQLEVARAFAKEASEPDLAQFASAWISEAVQWSYDEDRAMAQDWGGKLWHALEASPKVCLSQSDNFLHSYMDFRRLMTSGDYRVIDIAAIYGDLTGNLDAQDGATELRTYLGTLSNDGLRWMKVFEAQSSVLELQGFRP